jgi:hypothetical protein
MLTDLEKALASPQPEEPWGNSLIPGDQLWIPELSLDIEHRFRELEGPERLFQNEPLQGLFLHTAAQTLRFKFDANGAEIASTGRGKAVQSRPALRFHFNRPFLLCVKKRGAKQPFLVMWIDNSDWMQPVPPTTEEDP